MSDYAATKPNSWELSLLLGYNVLCFVSSLIGDTIILIATRSKDAFKLNKHLVAVIQHLAIIDLALCFVWVLPNIVNMASLVGWDHWLVDNEIFCEIKLALLLYFSSLSTDLMGVLTVIKLVILKVPLKVRTWKKRRAHFLSAALWIINLWVPITTSITFVNDHKISKNWVFIDWLPGYDFYPTIRYIHVVISILFPLLVVILSTVPTLLHLIKGRKVSRKSGGNLRWQGILTVSLTASTFFVSYLPYSITTIYHKSTIFIRIAWYLSAINIMSNFYIYLFTVRSFRKFVQLNFRILASYLGFRRIIERDRTSLWF